MCFTLKISKLPLLAISTSKNKTLFVCHRSNPTPQGHSVDFKPVTKDLPHILEINNDGLRATFHAHNGILGFWDDLYTKYAKIFSQTYGRDEL